MFWFFASLPLLLLTIGSWVLTGLSIVRGVFRVTSGLTTFALALPIGMVVQLVIINALGHFIFLPISIWAIVIGAVPISLICLRRPLPPLVWEIRASTRLVLLAMLLLLTLGVFYINVREIWDDDPGHASMIQLMAAGEFPLQFQCNPAFRASYGYGGDLLAAMTEVMSGSTPWDAMDIVKVVSVASVTMLTFLIGWRYKNKVGAGLLSVFLLFTVGTMVWLYLPLSVAGGRYMAQQTPITAALPPQLDVMTSSAWDYSVVPPGFLTTNYSHSERSLSWGFAPFIIFLTLAVLETPMAKRIKSLTIAVLVGTVGLLHPAALMILLPGLIGYTVLWFVSRQFKNSRLIFAAPDFSPYGTLALSFILLAIQGGPITDSITDKINGLSNVTTRFAINLFNLPSCRGGNPTVNCGLLSVVNVGLAPLLIPVLFWLAWRISKNTAWMIVLLGCMAAIGVTLVAVYGYDDWNIQRLITFSAWTAAVLLGPVLYDYFARPGWLGKVIVSGTVVLISYSGLVEAITIADGRDVRDIITQNFSPMVDPLELSMMKYGADLPLDARFFDPTKCTGVTAIRPAYLFGRYAVYSVNRAAYLTSTDTYQKLLKAPSADLLYSGGYTHLFIDSAWYYSLTPESEHFLRTGPLEVVGWAGTSANFRILMRVCAPDEGCIPYIPGFIDEFIPSKQIFGDSIQVTGYRRFIQADHSVHVDFTAAALKPMSNDFHFSLRLTRIADGKTFAIEGQIDTPTTGWSVGTNYVGHDVYFSNVPPGKYALSIRWYDVNTPDLHALPAAGLTNNGAADAVLISGLTVSS